MIKVIDGNLLDAKTDIIAHQTNCLGIMGGGVALAIRQKYPNVYETYRNFCGQAVAPVAILGQCEMVATKSGTAPFFVANLFGQCETGKGATNYRALECAMLELYKFMVRNDLRTVAMPYMIGCGLAGGDWNKVSDIILSVFGNTGISVELWRL